LIQRNAHLDAEFIENPEGKTEAADVTQPHLLLKFARSRTEPKSFPPMHLHRKHVVFCINLRPRTRFGTRGSEVQILSPRPTKKKRYQRFRTREIAFLWTLPRAGQIPASTVAVDCCYLPPTVAKRITRAGIVAASPAGCSLARPPLALRSGSPSLSSRPILSCSQAQGVGKCLKNRRSQTAARETWLIGFAIFGRAKKRIFGGRHNVSGE